MAVELFTVQPTGIGWPDYVTAISDPSSIAQAVYFDSVNGSAGTNYPTGTASEPVNNLPDLRTICTNRGIRKIVNIDISVLAVLDAAMLNYEFINWFLDLNGQNVTGSQFKNCSLLGIAGGTSLLASDSILSNITNAGQPYLSGCVVNNNFVLPTGVGVSAALINCQYLNCILFVNDNTVDLVGGTGTLEVRDVDNAASVLNIYGFGGHITLANTCTLGVINLYGDFVLTNNAAAGCTVNDYRISKEYGEDTVYFDSVGGEAGTAYPVGTATRPVDNAADLRAILVARRIKKVMLLSSLTLDAAMEGYQFTGYGGISWSYVIDFNNFSVDGSFFRGIQLYDSGFTRPQQICAIDCYITNMCIGNSTFLRCIFLPLEGSVKIIHTGAFASYVSMYDCEFQQGSRLSFNDETLNLGMLGCKGQCTIADASTTPGGMSAEFISGEITLENSVVAPISLFFYGDFDLVDNSVGAVIYDYRTHQNNTRFFQETVAATDVNGTTWKDLLDRSAIKKPVRVCGFIVTKGGVWVGNILVRIVDGTGTTKIYPFKAQLVETTDFTSAVQFNFTLPAEVSVSKGYKFQFASDSALDLSATGKTLALTSLDVQELS